MMDIDPAKSPGIGFTIEGVRVLGNKKTAKEVLLDAARVPVGKPFTLELRDRIQRDLLSSGFVRSADVNWEVSKERPNAVNLFLSVKEKITWFVAPNFSYTDGRYGGSVAFGDRNLGGIGKQLRVYLGYNTEAQRVSVRYTDPNIMFSPWGWGTLVGYSRSIFKDYDPTEKGIRRGMLLREQVFQRFSTELELKYRWFDWVTTGLRYRFGLVDSEEPLCLRSSPIDQRTFQRCPTGYEGLDPSLLGASWYVGPEAFLGDHGLWVDHTGQGSKFWRWRRDAGFVLFADVSRMRSVHGMEDGFKVDGELSVNHRHLGGSFDYVTWKAQYDHALSFAKSAVFGARHVLSWHMEYWQTHNAPYFREPRVGGTDLRGFLSQQFVGDSLARATVEYKVHLFHVGWLMVRAVAFWDTAWLFFRQGGAEDATLREEGDFRRVLLAGTPGPGDLRSWHNGIGAGLRVYIKGISFGTLGVDLAYGIEANRVRFVVMVGS
jgi:outer membrane protein assembly factor BamA